MKRRNAFAAAALAFCLAFTLTGCSKDSIINGFNDFLHHASQYALTDEKDLAGERTAGADTYTGAYTAEYDGFSGTEYLFGGTGLERESGNELTVTYELKVESGAVELYWIDGTERHQIADAAGSGTYTLSVGSRDCYIAIEGESLHGALALTVA